MADSSADLDALLAGLRPQVAGPRTRLRLHRIEALAARMARSEGPVRAVLEQRLERLLAESEATESRGPSQHDAEPRPARGRAALADLLAGLRARDRQAAPDAGPHPPGIQAGPESDRAAAGFDPLPALQAARQTWARLRMDEHLRHVMAEVPDDAGPMHSTVLVHRAIAVMHEAAPGYLQHFLGYADALAALERHCPAPAIAAPARTPRPRPRGGSTPAAGAPPRSRKRSQRRPA